VVKRKRKNIPKKNLVSSYVSEMVESIIKAELEKQIASK
jgi:hypothetical protein